MEQNNVVNINSPSSYHRRPHLQMTTDPAAPGHRGPWEEPPIGASVRILLAAAAISFLLTLFSLAGEVTTSARPDIHELLVNLQCR